MSVLESEQVTTVAPSVEPLQRETGEALTTHPEGDELQPAELITTANRHLRVFLPAQPPTPVTQASLEPLQEWEGVVESVDGEEFTARLTDITEAGEDEYTSFMLDEVSGDDLSLVVPGGVFYWTIARETRKSGQRRHVSMIRFRRLPAVRAAQSMEVRKEAERIADALGFSDAADAAIA